MTQKILITGANGFIGRHLVRTALDRGLEVYAGVRATSDTSAISDPRIRKFHFDMHEEDRLYTDLKHFRDAEGGFDYVIHNAAVNRPKDVSEFVTGNADFTREFARMLMETQRTMRKFVFMSTMAAIGPGNPDTMQPIDERHARRPVTPYGHSKLLAERYIHEIHALPYVILRPTGVYGPGDEKFIIRLINLVKRGIEISTGPADQKISVVYVTDLARLTLDACVSDVVREDFNVSDGAFYTQQTINATLREVLGVRTLKLRIPSRVLTATGFLSFQAGKVLNKPVHLTHLKMREVVARNWKVDIAKVRRTIGFEPVFDLKTGLKNVVDSLAEGRT